MQSMEPILIQIDWIYFLGIVGVLVGIAWYSRKKISALETSITRLGKVVNKIEERVTRLEVRMDRNI